MSALLGAAAPARAQDEAAHHWRALTQGDVEAAYRMLSEDHPGAVDVVGDTAFRRRLEQAHATARDRAGRTTSVEGYFSTMAAFATAMGDKHIWSRPLLASTTLDWAGFSSPAAGRNGWSPTKRVPSRVRRCSARF